MNNIVTSAEEGGYVLVRSVCLSVCLSVRRITREIFCRGRAWVKDQMIQFWWRSGSRFRSGSPKRRPPAVTPVNYHAGESVHMCTAL